jgi:hypothetical protein
VLVACASWLLAAKPSHPGTSGTGTFSMPVSSPSSPPAATRPSGDLIHEP